ncbi:hypothetical protein BJ508DRAFT_373196 [Ascobolus immersus RN42]|uniref:Uncharacterized protein n=1 Tax=Ascobolus immersus RN42 TaxID=1160509 RepID=A0A3N4IKS3_ASCIM|nr:hypothetical protein BJ508DRAFT_373196 [Ascobolus immersus RN42]
MATITPPSYFLSPSIHTLSTALPIPTPPASTPPTLYLTTRHDTTTRTPVLNIICSNTSTNAFHSATYFNDSTSSTEGVDIRWRYGSEEGGYMASRVPTDELVTPGGEGCCWISRRVVLDGGVYDLEGFKGRKDDVVVDSGDLWVTVGLQGL